MTADPRLITALDLPSTAELALLLGMITNIGFL